MRSHVASLVAVVAVSFVSIACAPPPGKQKIPPAVAGSCDQPTSSIGPGNVDGSFCGNVTAKGSITVAAGKTLTLQAGSVLAMPPGANITVDGTLAVEGTKDAPVNVTSTDAWNGVTLQTGGTVNAAFAKFSGQGASFFVVGGALNLTDTLVDLLTPATPPDCTPVESGSVTLDHVKIVGCHCPLHVDAGDTITVTNSILDGAVPIMISSATANMHHNNMPSTEFSLYDNGAPFTADVSGNHYNNGAAPSIWGNASEFHGADQFSTTEFTDVGPRF